MRVEIRGVADRAREATEERVRRRLHFALGRFGRRILRVVVRLEDTNGPRGGVDKRCRICVRLPLGRTLIVEAVHENLGAAIDIAADRAGRTVSRQIARLRDAA